MLARRMIMSASAGAGALSFVLLPGDLHDNNYSAAFGGCYVSSALARAVFTTTATSVTVDSTNNLYSTSSTMAEIGVRVDGAEHATINLTADGDSSDVVALPAGNKTVEIIAGPQNKPSTTLLGSFICGVTFNQIAYLVSPSTPSPYLVVYGDSISTGYLATNAVHDGWTALLRGYINTAVDAWGYRALNDEADAAARQALAEQLAGYNPTIVWMAIGVNDYTVNIQTAADFGTEYADLLDKIHTELPSAAIYAQSPIAASTESPNAVGDWLQEYRDAIETACSTRAWSTYVDGWSFLLTSDLSDGVHPTTSGHNKYYLAARDVLENPPASGDPTGWNTGAIAAYHPRGATSLSNSYENINNPGTYDITPTGTPWWMPSYGWRFTGTQWLDTGIFAEPGWTIMVKFANFRFPVSSSLYAICGALDTVTPATMYLLERQVNDTWYGYGNKAAAPAPSMTGGILALAANKGYRNGTLDATLVSPTFGGTSTRSLYIAARNDGSPTLIARLDVHAFAAWDYTLTESEIATKQAQWIYL